MTDEERAREIVQRHGRILPPERQMELGLAIWDAIQVSRADERENCARVAEAEAGEQGDGAINYHRIGALDTAAAIRARGSE